MKYRHFESLNLRNLNETFLAPKINLIAQIIEFVMSPRHNFPPILFIK